MKNGLLVASTLRNEKPNGLKNMGDYIQSLVGEMFFDRIDEYIDRETLAHYTSHSGKIKVIMNAWYMWFPENWPPSEDILPLLISMHISPIAASRMLSPIGIEYLKKYGPVGCRDKATELLLKQHNIPCYFSGCLTLLLGERYKTHYKTNRVIFVDPCIGLFRKTNGNYSMKILLKSFYYGIIHLNKVKTVQKIYCHSKGGG